LGTPISCLDHNDKVADHEYEQQENDADNNDDAKAATNAAAAGENEKEFMRASMTCRDIFSQSYAVKFI